MIATFVATPWGMRSLLKQVSIFPTINYGFWLAMADYCRVRVIFQSMPQEKINIMSSLTANIILFTIIVLFIVKALKRKINIFEAFIDGAKDGFKTAVTIIPYLIAILVGIGVFRASGARIS